MGSTGVYESGRDLPRLAVGYDLTDNGPVRSIVEHPTWLHASGGIYSTVRDLSKWNQYLLAAEDTFQDCDSCEQVKFHIDGSKVVFGGISRIR